MKNPFNYSAPSFDAKAINETIQRALASAGLDTTSGPMRDVTDTIQRALSSGGAREQGGLDADDSVIEVTARVVDDGADVIPRAEREPEGVVARTRGTFEPRQFSNAAGTRAYKLYVPVQSRRVTRTDGRDAAWLHPVGG